MISYKRFPKLLAMFSGLALCGCAGLGTSPLSQASPQRSLYAIRASYSAAFLAPAANYRELPPCDGAKFSVALPCSDPAIVKSLQRADAQVASALDTAQAYAIQHPGDISANGLIDAANAAISAAIALLQSNMPR